LVEGDDLRSELSFAFPFPIGRIDAVEICVAKFPCEVEARPEVKENVFKPARASELFAADFVVLFNVGLLELRPVGADII
jgi:hypothetical protein